MRVFHNANFNFIKWRWPALIGSIVLIWAGVASIYFKGGIPLGIEFTGGTEVILKFQQPVNEDAIRRAVDGLSKDTVVQQFGRPEERQIVVRLPTTPGREEGAALEEDARRVKEAVSKANLGSFEASTNIIGPVMGKDYTSKGIWATVAALGGMLVYIGFRFRFTFAIGAVVAAFHDILITLVLLVWSGYDMTLNIIAALLTITGYSVNDTIVVFDRVRENQRSMRREPLDEIVNKSVNQTLGRTMITSGVTLLAVLALYLFGGEVLRGFAFTMIVGVLTGTYSTVFIAASIAIILSRRTQPVQTPQRAERQAKPKRA